MDDKDFIEKSAPILSKISAKNPFTVPEGYFELLPAEVLERCSNKSSVWEKIKNLKTLLSPKISISFSILCLITILFVNKFALKQEAITVSDEVLAASEYVNNIEEDLILDEYQKVADKKEVKESPIDEYLLNQDIDPKDYENEDL